MGESVLNLYKYSKCMCCLSVVGEKRANKPMRVDCSFPIILLRKTKDSIENFLLIDIL